MGNNDFLPEEIRELPYPWCVTNAIKIREALSAITLTEGFVDASPNVMDRCLTLLPNLTNYVEEKKIHGYADYWSNYCLMIEWEIPSLADAKLSVFEENLRIWDDLSVSVGELVESWLFDVVPTIAAVCTQWVGTTLQHRYSHERSFRLKYLEIVERHWGSLGDPKKCRFAYSLSGAVGNDALPFLNEILAGDEAKYVKEAADSSTTVLLESENEDNGSEGCAVDLY